MRRLIPAVMLAAALTLAACGPASTADTLKKAEGIETKAGLEKALAEFPDDVAAAAAQALDTAGAVQFPTDPAVEPWPPMQAGIGL